MTREKIINFIAYLFFGLMICLPLTMSVISNTLIQLPLVQIAGLVLVFLILFYFITTNKITVIATSIFITVLAAVIFCDFYLSESDDNFVFTVITFFNGAYQSVLGYIPYSQDYSLVLVAIVALLLAFYFCMFYKVVFSYFTLLLVGIGVYAINILTGFFMIDVYFFIYLIAILALFLKQLNLSGNKSGGSVVYSLVITPVCIICVFSAGFMPIPGQKDLSVLKQVFSGSYEVMSDILYLAFNPKYFMFQTTGFSGRAKTSLGGNVFQNEAFVMDVMTDSPVYLTGDIKTVYSGREWGKTNISQIGKLLPIDKDSPSLDTLAYFLSLSASLELGVIDGFERINPNYKIINFQSIQAKDYPSGTRFSDIVENGGNILMLGDEIPVSFFQKKISVNVGVKRTYSMFVPPNVKSINYGDNVLMKDDGTTVSDQLIKSYAGYDIEYYDFENDDLFSPDYFLKSKGIYKLIEDKFSAKPNYFDYGFKLDGKKYYYKDILPELIEYSEYVYDNYLSLPDTLPNRVRELAEEITAAKETDYEKILAIQEYLKDFEYTLSPGPVPPDADFVDHFLFNGRKGYCTYFASAFAVLARCAGIPTRYMEGFAIAGDNITEAAYSVTNRMAHSWPEAYLEGYGWYLLDPTPSEGIGNYDPQIVEAFISDTDRGYMNNERPVNESPVYQRLGQNAQAGRSGVTGTGKFMTPKTLWFYMRLAGGICVGTFLVYALIYFLIKKYRFRKAEKAGYDRLAMCYFDAAYRYLVFFGDKREDCETLLQYGRRLCNRELYKHTVFHSVQDVDFMLKVAEIISKTTYSGQKVTREEAEVIMTAYDMLRKKYIFNTGLFKRIYYGYVLRSVN